MPIYVYVCEKCNHEIEKLQKHGDPPVTTCSECGGPMERVVSPPAIQFKGSGWYVTDYGPKSKNQDGESTTEKETPPAEVKEVNKDTDD